ncbi:hypothetical protein WAF17_12650 [Bernardetia sp. ABR2-2B]|uniref:hypothetical protein n=1 Tax=Bernardetia sp. ABR2-2B TaxID=3127472 RepID=UPI0030CD00F2
MGYLTTHTYRKPKYGWSETDKDQTFILLRLEELPIRRQKAITIKQKVEMEKAIRVGQQIEIGMSVENLKNELANPIYIEDSSFVFLGKNKIIGRFEVKNNKVKSITYGRFHLNDSIFDLDSIALRSVIEEKLEGVK